MAEKYEVGVQTKVFDFSLTMPTNEINFIKCWD